MVVANPPRIINPQNPSTLSTIPTPFKLGPLDDFTGHFPAITVVMIYEAGSSPISLDHLETALGYLLNYYPHLSGRLQLDFASGKFSVDHLGTGAELHQAALDKPLSAFRKSGVYSIMDQPGGSHDLMPPCDPSLAALAHTPILMVKHTRFACGGVALGIRVPHALTDGDGFDRLAHDLASIYRGLDGPEAGKLAPGREPCLLPFCAKKVDEAEKKIVGEYQPALFSLAPPAAEAPADIPTPPLDSPPPLRAIGRELHFSSSDLTHIRQLASDPSLPKPFSSFVAFSAWLYKQIHSARVILQSRTSYEMTTADFFTPLDLRKANRLPNLPSNYVPNASFPHYTSITPDDLSVLSLSEIAQRILEMITTSATVGAEAEFTLKWLAAQSSLANVRFGMKHGPGAFCISEWSKFDMYGEGAVQFVEGERPVLVSPPFTPVSLPDGYAFMLPPHPKDGKEGDGIEVYLALVEPLWEILDREGLLDAEGA